MFSKGFICFFCVLCLSLTITQNYVKKRKINYLIYTLLFFCSILILIFLSYADDILTAYLTIEFQIIVFYFSATFKKKSMHLLNAGFKYFVLGLLSSSFFLFGSYSIMCKITSVINLNDFYSSFYYMLTPATVAMESLNVKKYCGNDEEQQNFLLLMLTKKIRFSENKPVITQKDIETIEKELELFHICNYEYNFEKSRIYMDLRDALNDAANKYSVRENFSLDKLSDINYKLHADYMSKNVPNIILLFLTEDLGVRWMRFLSKLSGIESININVLTDMEKLENTRILNSASLSDISLLITYFFDAENCQMYIDAVNKSLNNYKKN